MRILLGLRAPGSARYGGYRRNLARVGTRDHNRLVLVCVVLHDASGQDIERSTEEYVVGCVANDMNLEVELDVAYTERYVA